MHCCADFNKNRNQTSDFTSTRRLPFFRVFFQATVCSNLPQMYPVGSKERVFFVVLWEAWLFDILVCVSHS